MKLNFLFWNLRGNHTESWEKRSPSLKESLANLVSLRHVDILILTEYRFEDADLIENFSQAGAGTFYPVKSLSNRIKIFCRTLDKKVDWKQRYSDEASGRMVGHSFRVGKAKNILLFGMHGYDRRSVPKEADIASHAQDLVEEIQEVENRVGHYRTIVVGDFNMTPYEQGMVATKSFHAIMSKRLVRTVAKLESRIGYRCFYNPMWSLLGDHEDRPPGSFFFSDATLATNPFWMLLDQVIVRQPLMDAITNVSILNHDGENSLVTKKGRPKRAIFSDHLPLYFTIDIDKLDTQAEA